MPIPVSELQASKEADAWLETKLGVGAGPDIITVISLVKFNIFLPAG